eukprot:1140305-Pelagomonas_calceolata.AAC.2
MSGDQVRIWPDMEEPNPHSQPFDGAGHTHVIPSHGLACSGLMKEASRLFPHLRIECSIFPSRGGPRVPQAADSHCRSRSSLLSVLDVS